MTKNSRFWPTTQKFADFRRFWPIFCLFRPVQGRPTPLPPAKRAVDPLLSKSYPAEHAKNRPFERKTVKKRRSESQLADLPNVGREVARLLAAAGIRSPDELKRLGAVAAAMRIQAIRPDDPPCRSMLAGLAGAIRNVRWHAIPKSERDALWRDYEARTRASSRPLKTPKAPAAKAQAETGRRPTTIAEYIRAAPPKGLPHLRRLYAILKSVAPEAQETLKWGTPFFVEPRFLFAFSAHKAHLDFAPTAAGLDPFRKELEKHKTTQGIFQIPYNRPLPEDLVRKIAERRLRDVRKRKDDAFW